MHRPIRVLPLSCVLATQADFERFVDPRFRAD